MLQFDTVPEPLLPHKEKCAITLKTNISNLFGIQRTWICILKNTEASNHHDR